MKIILTVADHMQNGFIALAQWPGISEPEARQIIFGIDHAVPHGSEPDIATADFTFILGLISDDGCTLLDTGEKLLPTQISMRIAPDQVSQWLADRPDPDTSLWRAAPILPLKNLQLVAVRDDKKEGK